MELLLLNFKRQQDNMGHIENAVHILAVTSTRLGRFELCAVVRA